MAFMNNIHEYKDKKPSEILEHFNMDIPPFNPFLLAERIGINVSTNIADWDKLGYDGEIYLDENKVPEIWINPTQHDNRQKFTLAHELGHLFNDVIPNIDHFRDPIKDDYSTLRRSSSWDGKEYKANRFAAQLLMPKDSIKTNGKHVINVYLSENNVNSIPRNIFIDKMSQIFQVSTAAMEYRLINLGVLKKKNP